MEVELEGIMVIPNQITVKKNKNKNFKNKREMKVVFGTSAKICMTNSHKHHECNSMVCGGKMTMSSYITRLMYRSQLII